MADDITIRIGADNEATKVLRKVGKDVDTFGNKVASVTASIARSGALAAVGLAAAGTAAAVAGVRSELERIDKVAKSSRALGIATADMVGLTLAAEEFSGVSADQLDKALKKQANSVSEAAKGVGEAKETFDELGLSAEALNQLDTADAFREIADAISKVDNDTDRLRMTQDIYGRGASQLVNTLAEGSAGFDTMKQRAVELGLTFSDAEGQGVEKLNDAITELKASFTGLATQLTVLVAPALVVIVDKLTEAAGIAREASDDIAQVFGNKDFGGFAGVGAGLADELFKPKPGAGAKGGSPFGDIFPADAARPAIKGFFDSVEQFFINADKGQGIGPVLFGGGDLDIPEPSTPSQLFGTESRLLTGGVQTVQEKMLKESEAQTKQQDKIIEQLEEQVRLANEDRDTLAVEEIG